MEKSILRGYEIERFPSGIIIIAFECVGRDANVFRNSDSVFTLTQNRDGVILNQEVVSIPELECVGTGIDYYATYTSEKETALVHCIPMKFYEKND